MTDTNRLFAELISNDLQTDLRHTQNVLELLADGATIPFISRYRKERTGGMDEVCVGKIEAAAAALKNVEQRKKAIAKSIEEQGAMNGELAIRIDKCWNLTELEDIYLPYKPKRETRATVARRNGLEPLAKMLMAQKNGVPESMARTFVGKQVENAEAALAGARDIMAEWISESENARHAVRNAFGRTAVIRSKVKKQKENEAEKFRDYFAFEMPLRKCPSHRLLAIRRGEAEGFLTVDIAPGDEKDCVARLEKIFVRADNLPAEQVALAVKDAYKRLLKPSIENEFSASSKKSADEAAIAVFSENLRQLLLSPPLGGKRVLGVDPGFRTGCKVVCLDEQGNLRHNETIFPHAPRNECHQSTRTIQKLVEQYKIQAIAIGNGTAGRESETFFQNIRYDRKVQIFSVSENGASIYSASDIAREEFPDYDITVRGAVSIGRRLMDPLAELVKIDPKSIGVGQYQHDVDQTQLKASLTKTVEHCVNTIGVNVNTASPWLLQYVSGLGKQLARNIVDHRAQNGLFTRRSQLLDVPKMGPKTYQQCAGFLRIPDAENPLDNSSVHPESYGIVDRMAKSAGCPLAKLIGNENALNALNLNDFVTEKTGLPTLTDIKAELLKPGRDPRTAAQIFEFDPSVRTIDDLQTGKILPGIVTNITNFGAFVDIGIKENGLLHISQMSDNFIENPMDVVSLHQHVTVRVVEIDRERKRINLSMKNLNTENKK